uniref:SEA domain-containing protein n=1 Tax=Cebus imitator TaxID=2715852 RepID=A0A2K5PVK7_CEBIM
MTPGIQSPFFLLLLLIVLTVLTGSGHASFTEGGEKTGTTHRNSAPSSTRNVIPIPTITKSCGETFLNWPGSVVVESTLAFREGTTSVQDVETQFDDRKEEAVSRYDLNVSAASVRDVPFPVSSPSGAGVPGWGIALLVLVCVLVALAVIYLVALAVWQCRRKNYGQLDIFPARDAYHPMSEYPTYHTHGRYVPPGSTNRSPYEEVSAGNGGSSLSYTNPAVAATSANL